MESVFEKNGLGSEKGFLQEARPPRRASLVGSYRAKLCKEGTLIGRTEEEPRFLPWRAADRT